MLNAKLFSNCKGSFLLVSIFLFLLSTSCTEQSSQTIMQIADHYGKAIERVEAVLNNQAPLIIGSSEIIRFQDIQADIYNVKGSHDLIEKKEKEISIDSDIDNYTIKLQSKEDVRNNKKVIKARVDLTQKQFIDGISILERHKYFNIHEPGNFQTPPGMSREEMAGFLIEELNINYGRRRGEHHLRTDVPEDPERPGYADPAWFKNGLSRHAEMLENTMMLYDSERVDLIRTGAEGGIPAFMVEGKPEGKYETIEAIKDPQAFAEYVALSMKYESSLPTFYLELFNEPSGTFQLDWDYLAEIYKAVAKEVSLKIPEVYVGGPCNRHIWGWVNWRNFWSDALKPFIDAAGKELDALAYHSYDGNYPADYHLYEFKGDSFFSSGGRDEAALDLLENYTLNTLGEVKPAFLSEFGGYSPPFHDKYEGGSANATSMLSENIQNWYMINSTNRKLMSYLNRPTTIIKAVPFITIYRSWSDMYYNRILRPDEDTFRITTMRYFYDFWREVEGDRIVTQVSDYNLQTAAFIKDRKVYIVLDNFYNEEIEVYLENIIDDNLEIKKKEYQRLFIDTKEKKTVLTPFHDAGTNFNSFKMSGHEKILLKLTLNEAPVWNRALNEISYYGDKVLQAIEANKTEAYKIQADLKEGKAAKAHLRIGMSRDVSLSRNPEVKLNGVILDVPDYDWGSSQEFYEEYLAVKKVDVPVEILKEINEVEISYPDSGGDITTVILVINHQLKGSVFASYTEEYYINKILPGEFNLSEPENNTNQLDPNSVKLSWSKSQHADRYRLLIAEDELFNTVVVDKTLEKYAGSGFPRGLKAIEANSIELNDLRFGQSYYWHVRAISDGEKEEMLPERWNTEGIQKFNTKKANAIPEMH